MTKYLLVLEKAINKDLETIPLPRSGHRCATDGVFLYSFGGFNPETRNKLFYKNIWCLHLNSKRWYKIITDSFAFGRVPVCVASSVVVLHNNQFIVFGGSGFPFGTSNSNQIFECDLLEQRWHCGLFLPEDIIPVEGYGQGVAVASDCMYIFGGTKGNVYNNNLYKFSFKTRKWDFINCHNPPLARYRHEMVSVNDGFIVIGGYGNYGACPLDTLPKYNFESCNWVEIKCKQDPDHGFPKPRRAHSCVKFEDNVYVCGGFAEETNETIYNDIWKLNILTFSWKKIPQVK